MISYVLEGRQSWDHLFRGGFGGQSDRPSRRLSASVVNLTAAVVLVGMVACVSNLGLCVCASHGRRRAGRCCLVAFACHSIVVVNPTRVEPCLVRQVRC